MGLVLPPGVTRELLGERHQHAAEVVAMTHMKEVMDDYNRQLKQIDPYLELIKAKENPSVTTAALKPGYWHIIRHNPGAPVSIITIQSDEGDYREPDSSIFTMVQRMDWWNPLVRRERDRKAVELKTQRERRERQEEEERRLELFERLDANTKVRVSMNRDNPWSQNVAGRRGVR